MKEEIKTNQLQEFLNEMNEYSENESFNSLLDDGELEDGSQIIWRKGDQEVPLAKPSRALYYGDRELYLEVVGAIRRVELENIILPDEYNRNESVFEEMSTAVRRGVVIPFIGAGMSVDAGCPSWSKYVIERARQAKLDITETHERLSRGEYEHVISDVYNTPQKLGA